MSRSPPLRFLVLLLAGWTGMRAAWLAPGGWSPPAEAGGARKSGASRPEGRGPATPARPAERPLPRTSKAFARAPSLVRADPPPRGLPGRIAAMPWQALPGHLASPHLRTPPSYPDPDRHSGAAPAEPPSRWSLAAWSFLRQGAGAAFLPGGTLGGSQVGARAVLRLNSDPARPLALALRVAAPVQRPGGAEAAFGIDWSPSRRIPLHFLLERRQALAREGRSAFGLMLHGGVSDAPIAGLRIDAYAQAGIVGTRSRDLFGDGAVRLSVPLGRLRLGAGGWAAAQPGIARLDLGPQASLRLPLAGRSIAVAADWRFRVAGDARPGSGPALTIATDF